MVALGARPDCCQFGDVDGQSGAPKLLDGGSSRREEEPVMAAPLRCDHCDAILASSHIERDCKRFCCSDCAKAFDRGELKAISPHAHPNQDLAASPSHRHVVPTGS